MSELTIFIVGTIIFAITVYGSVIGGGIGLSRLADREDESDRPVDDPDAEPSRNADSRR